MTAFDELYSDWQEDLSANDVPISREQFKQALLKVQLALRGARVELDLRGASREGEPPASQIAVDFAFVSLNDSDPGRAASPRRINCT